MGRLFKTSHLVVCCSGVWYNRTVISAVAERFTAGSFNLLVNFALDWTRVYSFYYEWHARGTNIFPTGQVRLPQETLLISSVSTDHRKADSNLIRLSIMKIKLHTVRIRHSGLSLKPSARWFIVSRFAPTVSFLNLPLNFCCLHGIRRRLDYQGSVFTKSVQCRGQTCVICRGALACIGKVQKVD